MRSHTQSKVVGLQFSILSPEEIVKNSVAEITSRDTYINNKPVIMVYLTHVWVFSTPVLSALLMVITI